VTVNSHFADPAFGKVWFATQSGVVAADATWTPGERPRPAWAPAIREVTTTQGRVVFTGTWSDGPERTWTENESAVRFSYAAPTYGVDHAGRPHARYRSRLDGLDADWGPWTTETLATYTNLPGRNFVFRVQARDILGNESREARFAFAIPPPWWRTWWFVGIAGISGVGSVAGVTRWLANRALRRRLQMLEARSAVERERLRLARDLHDEVGSGLGRVILFAGEARRYQADAVQLESALDRVRDTAQELVQHAREIVWAVSPQHDTLASVIERLGDYAEETLRAAGIACRVDAAGGADLPVVMLGSEARHSLFLALKEAVHNCVKYSGAKTAEFRLHVAEQHLVVTLCDHGRGFSPGEKQGTGHGLVNIAARAEAFHGEATVTSEVGKGTTVTLRVPLGGKPAAVS
jgi:signal transduction histidine kinase